ncbi:MAG: twin-arginine translocation signal domain-containing protein, partial [Acidobacteriota bacterium]|nr:twin-arginine translocation signal domain-containing protein [Acidobacteriota bacterium]
MAEKSVSRRNFVKTGAAAGAGLLIVSPQTAFGSVANSSLGLGIIGCGGRGNYDGGEFLNNTDVRVT